MSLENRKEGISFFLVLAAVIAVVSLYAFVNWSVVQEVLNIIADNMVTIWFATLVFVIAFGILFRLLSDQSRLLPAMTLLLTLFGTVTLLTFYLNSQWSLFLPSGPIASALQAGNLPLGILGYVIVFATGFALCLLIIKSLLSSAFLAFGIGAGVVTLEMFFLSFLQLLYPSYALLLPLLVLAVLLTLARHKVYALRNVKLRYTLEKSFKSWESIAVLGVGAAFFAVIFFEALAYPSTEWDSLAYGLPYAKLIYELHTIPLISGPSIGIEISANYPPGMQLLAAFFYNLAGGAFDIYYRLLEPTLAIALLLAVYRLGYVVFEERRYAAITVLAVFSFPIWYYAIGTSYVMYTAAESAIVLFAALVWRNTKQDRYIVLSGVAAGFASLTSYIGFLCFIFPAFVILIEKRSGIITLKRLLVMILSGAFSAAWLIRNLVELGNPLYPLGGRGLNLTPSLYSSTASEIIDNGNTILHSLNSFLSFTLNESNGIEGPVLFVILVGLLLFFISKKEVFSKTRHEILSISLVIIYAVLGFIFVTYANGFFLRYFVPFSPGFALGFTFLYREFGGRTKFPLGKVLLLFLVIGLLMSGLTIEGYTAIQNQGTNSEISYLYQKFGMDVLSWNWINNHTPTNAVIATYEIRTYYINRTVVPLDGYAMAGLYESNETPGQILSILHSENVSYILSVDWASPLSPKTPAAYYESALTKYLGDPSYFPTVYANGASAVYKVVDNASVDASYLPANSTLYLSTYQMFETALTNNTSPPSSMINIPVQPDLLGDEISISENSLTINTSLDWFAGTIPASMTNNWWSHYASEARSPPLSQGLGSLNPAIRVVAQPGHYTLVIVDRSPYKGPVNVTINISILPTYRFNALIPSLGEPQPFEQITNNSAYSVLYFTPQGSGKLNVIISNETNASYTAFAVFNNTVPFNGYSGWNDNYEMNMVKANDSGIVSSSAFYTYNVSAGTPYSFVIFNGTSISNDFSKLDLNITFAS